MSELSWRCTLRFELRHGELSREAEANLTKRGVRRVVPLTDGGYMYECSLAAPMFNYASTAAAMNLSAILNIYDVHFEVVEAKVVKDVKLP